MNNIGFRKLPGTSLKNAATGETVYTPPQDTDKINGLMGNLERFIHEREMSDLDPLVKMAVVHFQFESTHSFYDRNGRIGRIINILYLILEVLVNLPILNFIYSSFWNNAKRMFNMYLALFFNISKSALFFISL